MPVHVHVGTLISLISG
ncbi:hypothetical protein MXB_287 [Myxobolus squamalis]|nr:hypothetical protein MXB_287 [Myxobolus squamalis]